VKLAFWRRGGTTRRETPDDRWHPHFGAIGGKSLESWLADYPPAASPEKSIVLATTERTGSEFLCQLMGASGRLGRPTEYLNTWWMRRFIQDYPDCVGSQVAIAHRIGTTRNRCFAMKLHAWHFDRLSGAFPFERVFPRPVFIRLVRQDLLAQAISLYRARHSSKYHFYTNQEREPVFDANGIGEALRELVRTNARWELFFRKNGVTPMTVSYEDLVTDQYSVIRRIARHAGEPVRRRDLRVRMPLQVQRDEISEEWEERFLADKHNLDTLENV
jgi:LPS sulfotransferase NodH